MNPVEQHNIMRELIESSASVIDTAVQSELETDLIEINLNEATERREAAFKEVEGLFTNMDKKCQSEFEQLQKEHEQVSKKTLKLLVQMTENVKSHNERLATMKKINASDVKKMEKRVEALERDIKVMKEKCFDFHAKPRLLFSDTFKSDVRKVFSELAD